MSAFSISDTIRKARIYREEYVLYYGTCKKSPSRFPVIGNSQFPMKDPNKYPMRTPPETQKKQSLKEKEGKANQKNKDERNTHSKAAK